MHVLLPIGVAIAFSREAISIPVLYSADRQICMRNCKGLVLYPFWTMSSSRLVDAYAYGEHLYIYIRILQKGLEVLPPGRPSSMPALRRLRTRPLHATTAAPVRELSTEPSTPTSPTLHTRAYRRALGRQRAAGPVRAVLHYVRTENELQPWLW